MYHIVDLVTLFLTNQISEDGIWSYSQTDDQVDKDADQSHTASDCSERIISGKSADNSDICGVE